FRRVLFRSTATRAWSHRLNRRTTWPANKSKVEIAGCSVRANSAAGVGRAIHRSAPLLRLDVGRADNLAPHFGLDLDAACEFLRRAGDGFETERGQAFLHVRQRDDSRDLALNRADDLIRRSGWGQKSDPAVALDVRIAGLGGRRDVGEELRALLARERERTQLPGSKRVGGLGDCPPGHREVAARLEGNY